MPVMGDTPLFYILQLNLEVNMQALEKAALKRPPRFGKFNARPSPAPTYAPSAVCSLEFSLSAGLVIALACCLMIPLGR